MSSIDRFRRRHLPHWDIPGAPFFITACLEGSIPARGVLEIDRFKTALDSRPRPENKSERDWATEKWKRHFVATEKWLDERPAVMHLADADLATIVVDALFFFAGQRYDLLAFVVMPSHFHWVFQPRESVEDDKDERPPRERIMHSIKSYTGNACNRRLKLQGTFWQQESYDHWVRNAEELERIIQYVENNPVKAGLVSCPEKWPFGSARVRQSTGVELGMPLLRG